MIGFEDDLPSRVWVRDLEGTKLLAEKWPEQRLKKLSEWARTSIYYSREQGWRRIAYCALINNVSEGIFHGAMGDPRLEKCLWQ